MRLARVEANLLVVVVGQRIVGLEPEAKGLTDRPPLGHIQHDFLKDVRPGQSNCTSDAAVDGEAGPTDSRLIPGQL